MKSVAGMMVGIIACFVLFPVSMCFAQLSDLEQRTLRSEATKYAQEIGVSQDQMYQNFALLHLAKQSQKLDQKVD